jgi:hypothetical protein
MPEEVIDTKAVAALLGVAERTARRRARELGGRQSRRPMAVRSDDRGHTGREENNSSMTAMSEDAIRQRAAELGAVYLGAAEFKEIFDELETLSLESERLQSKPQPELSEAEYRSLFPPTP